MLESKTYFIENRNQQIAYKKYGLQGDETIVFQHGLTSKKKTGILLMSRECLTSNSSSTKATAVYQSIASRMEKVPNLPKQQTMIVIYLLSILSL